VEYTLCDEDLEWLAQYNRKLKDTLQPAQLEHIIDRFEKDSHNHVLPAHAERPSPPQITTMKQLFSSKKAPPRSRKRPATPVCPPPPAWLTPQTDEGSQCRSPFVRVSYVPASPVRL
jgi:hypothetical protein